VEQTYAQQDACDEYVEDGFTRVVEFQRGEYNQADGAVVLDEFDSAEDGDAPVYTLRMRIGDASATVYLFEQMLRRHADHCQQALARINAQRGL
jgi:hypothetical protein